MQWYEELAEIERNNKRLSIRKLRKPLARTCPEISNSRDRLGWGLKPKRPLFLRRKYPIGTKMNHHRCFEPHVLEEKPKNDRQCARKKKLKLSARNKIQGCMPTPEKISGWNKKNYVKHRRNLRSVWSTRYFLEDHDREKNPDQRERQIFTFRAKTVHGDS